MTIQKHMERGQSTHSHNAQSTPRMQTEAIGNNFRLKQKDSRPRKRSARYKILPRTLGNVEIFLLEQEILWPKREIERKDRRVNAFPNVVKCVDLLRLAGNLSYPNAKSIPKTSSGIPNYILTQPPSHLGDLQSSTQQPAGQPIGKPKFSVKNSKFEEKDCRPRKR